MGCCRYVGLLSMDVVVSKGSACWPMPIPLGLFASKLLQQLHCAGDQCMEDECSGWSAVTQGAPGEFSRGCPVFVQKHQGSVVKRDG